MLLKPLLKRFRHFRDRAGPRGGILMYHRIAAERFDPWDLCVTPDHFEQQMAALADRRATRDLVHFGSSDAYTQQGDHVAVTFDDGYYDNVATALPILERYEVPATIFIVSGALGRKREFWWDALTRAIFEPDLLPMELSLEIDGQTRQFTRQPDPDYDVAREEAWRADQSDASTSRQLFFIDLWSFIVTLRPEAQDHAIDQIFIWSGCDPTPPADALPIDPEEVARLARHPLIRIGSHTEHHASLTDFTPAEQKAQIGGCKDALEEIIGADVSCFSYPFGRLDDAIVDHVRQSGIALACTSRSALATPKTDPHMLPRLQVFDDDGEGFMRWLSNDYGLFEGKGGRA